MKIKLLWRFVIIIAAIVLAGLSIRHYGVKRGIDLQGGTDLLYELDLKNFQGQIPADIAQRVIDTLKRRVDPNGTKNLVWRIVGGKRIEIQMPFADTASKQSRENYDAAIKALAESNLKPADIETAMRAPADQRPALLERIAAGDADRRKLLNQLAGAYDKLQAAQAQAAKFPAASVPTKVLEDLTAAQSDYDTTRLQLLSTNLDINHIEELLDDRLKPKNTTAQPELDRLIKDHPTQATLIANVVAAREKYDENAGGSFSDAQELQRQLVGAGVLDFRIAVESSDAGISSTIDQAVRDLQSQGPRASGKSNVRWFEVDPDSGDNLLRGGYVVVPYHGKNYILLYDDPARTMTHDPARPEWKLIKSQLANDPSTGNLILEFGQDVPGGLQMYALTSTNLHHPMAILLDDRAISAPNINSAISDNGEITFGTPTPTHSAADVLREAKDLEQILEAGSLPAALQKDPISVKTISSQLGADNIKAGIRSGYIAVVAVMVFMVAYYTITGMFADVALMINLVITVGVMSQFAATWTLPGIAGVVLTLGMAVDANILINERIREELHKGASLWLAVRQGYDKVFWTIFDANLTTSLTSIVLIFVGSEEVKGFGVTLLIGLIIHMFTALFVTRTLMYAAIKARVFRAIDDLSISEYMRDIFTGTWLKGRWPFMRVVTVSNIDWIAKRHIFWVLSLVLIGLGVVSLLARGRDAYDTEFNGGTQVTFQLKPGQTMDVGEVRQRVADIAKVHPNLPEAPEAVIQEVGDQHNEFTVVTGIADTSKSKRKDEFLNALADQFQNVLRSQPRVTYSGVEVDKLHVQQLITGEQPVIYAVTKPTLDQVISNAPPGIHVEDFFGGSAIVLDHITPPQSVQELSQRISSTRQNSEYSKIAYRDFKIFALDPPNSDGPLTRAVMVSIDPTVSFQTMPVEGEANAWRDNFVQSEWDILNAALTAPQRFSSVVSFDPQVAGSAKQDAVLAIVLSLILIVIYVWIRFGGLRYGMGAIFSLLHDAMVAVAATVLSGYLAKTTIGHALMIEDFKINLTMIAAYLTIIGYSVNDTIVIFDRIRENRGRTHTPLSAKLVNDSINQCFGRTIWTTFTVFIVVLIMYIWGGSGIHGFAYAMLIGVFTGAYSTLAIASPMLLNVKEKPKKVSAFELVQNKFTTGGPTAG